MDPALPRLARFAFVCLSRRLGLWYHQGMTLFIRNDDGEFPPEPNIAFEEVTDPAEIARFKAQMERGEKNSDWIQVHWTDVLPQARGKFLAVASQEAFIADTPEEAWEWAERTHPEDDGALVRYVPAKLGIRIYANRG